MCVKHCKQVTCLDKLLSILYVYTSICLSIIGHVCFSSTFSSNTGNCLWYRVYIQFCPFVCNKMLSTVADSPRPNSFVFAYIFAEKHPHWTMVLAPPPPAPNRKSWILHCLRMLSYTGSVRARCLNGNFHTYLNLIMN